MKGGVFIECMYMFVSHIPVIARNLCLEIDDLITRLDVTRVYHRVPGLSQITY